MKYRVLMQQYVEQVAAIDIEADTPEEARDLALNRAASAEWGPGDDAYDVDVYAVTVPVMDGVAAIVWER